ncbi:hypothetical protein ANANG_G00070910 [Anguilla anguilla]|uniref:RNA-binding protein 14 n=1 Tax=Anguilla anguilla TaxID=7936 RepID=A0A9D3MSH7_ANGAN|nr:hypothetical protein ANANG_G00070910 [Anguilla anguilla]
MVKIFIGNLSQDTTAEELRSVFSQYGTVSECDVLKRYGFVHMDSKADAEEAIRNLNQRELNGMAMNVELSRGKSRATTKLHVSNLSSGCTNQELRAKFEEYGPVVECDIVKDYAFVHMERVEDAMEAISGLDNTAFQGKLMSVQLSTSRLRTAPGMGDHAGCFVCGEPGHWSKDCHLAQNGGCGVGPGVRAAAATASAAAEASPRELRVRQGRAGVSRRTWDSERASARFLRGLVFRGRGGLRGGGVLASHGPQAWLRAAAAVRLRSAGPVRRQGRERLPRRRRRRRYESQRHSGVDFYEQFRARPYGAGASYGDERHLSSAYSSVPASPAISRERLPLDPYGAVRRPSAGLRLLVLFSGPEPGPASPASGTASRTALAPLPAPPAPGAPRTIWRGPGTPIAIGRVMLINSPPPTFFLQGES